MCQTTSHYKLLIALGADTYTYAHTYTYARIHIHTHTHICILICIHTHIYTHTYTERHAHMLQTKASQLVAHALKFSFIVIYHACTYTPIKENFFSSSFHTQQQQILTIASFFLSLIIIMLLLKLYTKAFHAHPGQHRKCDNIYSLSWHQCHMQSSDAII